MQQSGLRAALATALAAVGLSAAAVPAQATTATCHFEAHVTFSSPIGTAPTSGEYASDNAGSADCHGTLGDTTASSGGSYQMSGRYGSYAPWSVPQSDNCVVGIGAGTIDANVPRLIAFFNDTSITVSGSETFRRAGDTIELRGNGYADRRPVAWSGVAQLVPDSGQDCVNTPLSSARIVETVTFTDGSKDATEAGDSSQPAQPAAPRNCGRGYRRAHGRCVRSARRACPKHGGRAARRCHSRSG